MKYLYYGLNIFLILTIPLMLFMNDDSKKIEVSNDLKSLSTSILIEKNEIVDTNMIVNTEKVDEEKNSETTEVINESLNTLENTVSQSIASPQVISDVLETETGAMSAYEVNCSGCSGRLGSGVSPLNGYIYNDATYGNVRIVAGDPSYPYGTIVRVKGSKLNDFYAIVLDRGGAIGKSRKFMFDLLFSSYNEAIKYGTEYGLVFEVVRYGF